MRGSKTKNSGRKRRATTSEPEAAPRVVVLAAGVGSRMRSALPKVLHRIGGRTLLDAVLDTAEEVSPSRIVAVVGAGREIVARHERGQATTEDLRQAMVHFRALFEELVVVNRSNASRRAS